MKMTFEVDAFDPADLGRRDFPLEGRDDGFVE